MYYALANGAQFILLGPCSDRGIEREFWQLKREVNDNPDCHLEIGFSESLAHQVYAGADMVVAPSLFEPCGLAPMIAMKYGAVPIVRGVGGLVDTVFDRDYDWRPTSQRNGYVFYQPDAQGIESALWRAIRLWYDYPCEFRELMLNGMSYDYSWNRAGADYVRIYDYIRH